MKKQPQISEELLYSKIYKSFLAQLSELLSEKDLSYLSTKFSTNPVFLKSICLIHKWIDDCLKGENELESSQETIFLIGKSNLEACFAYTMYDYVRDGKIEPSKISVAISIANILIKRSITNFLHLSPSKTFCLNILDMCETIDNFYLKNTQSFTENKRVNLTFSSFADKVFEKSIGMAITPLLMVVLKGYEPHTTHYKQTFAFFKHYLCARQLSDDQDDWQKDLLNNIVTPATILIHSGEFTAKQINKMIRLKIDKNLKLSLKALKSIPNFDYQKFTQKYVVKC